jgi:hypothetical protein
MSNRPRGGFAAYSSWIWVYRVGLRPRRRRSAPASSARVTVTALKKLTATPSPSVMAKPRTTSVPRMASTMQAMIVETLLSRIAGNARRKPVSTAGPTLLPWRNSSRVRSKMSTLASTAMPTLSTNPARPARVTVTGMSL